MNRPFTPHLDLTAELPRFAPPRHARRRRRAASKGPLLPDMDPCDLDLILTSLLRPFGSGRRFFLHEVRPGVCVF